MVSSLLIPIIIVVGVALLILWAIGRFLPEVAEPARIIVGIIVIVFLLMKLLPLLGV